MPRSIEVEIISQLEVEIIGMKFSGGHVECVEGNQFTIIKYNKKEQHYRLNMIFIIVIFIGEEQGVTEVL